MRILGIAGVVATIASSSVCTIGCSRSSGTTAPGSSTGGSASGSSAVAMSGSGTPSATNGIPSASPATIEAVLVEIERLKNAMCACSDVACTDGVTKQHAAYRPTVDATVKATPPIPEQRERIARHEDELRGCRRWVAAGLGSNSGGGEANAILEISLVELERYRNKMCSCADKACGDKLVVEYDAWRKQTDAELGDREPNESQAQRRALHEKSYADCRAKLK